MSLTSMLDQEKEFQIIMREHIPGKKDFVTNTDKPAFSHDYPVVAPNKLSNSWYAGISGTAFDFMSRFIISHTTGNAEILENTAAEKGYKRLLLFSPISLRTKLERKYEKSKDCINAYLTARESNFSEIISDACFLAKLEMFFRSGGYPHKDGYESIVDETPGEIIEDVEKLCEEFCRVFIGTIIKPDSCVVFNPGFGMLSQACGGADADLFVDGTIYDFKTSKNLGYKWREVAQIFGYFILDCLEKISNENNILSIGIHPVRKIAFYRARYGIVEETNVNKISSERLLDVLVKVKTYLYGRKTEKIVPEHKDDPSRIRLIRNLDAEHIREWISSERGIDPTSLRMPDVASLACRNALHIQKTNSPHPRPFAVYGPVFDPCARSKK